MTSLERWIYRARPGCCEKCEELNGEIRSDEPEYNTAHNNCKCKGWVQYALNPSRKNTGKKKKKK